MVRYRVADLTASHEAYMQGLGVNERQYPGFSEDPLEGFVHLAADLTYATDFLRGDAFVLRRVAAQEAAASAVKTEDLMAGYVGDTAAVERMRELFRAQDYRQVVEVFERLQYPQRLSPAELKMVEVARHKAGG